jgi:hypothetical protein
VGQGARARSGPHHLESDNHNQRVSVELANLDLTGLKKRFRVRDLDAVSDTGPTASTAVFGEKKEEEGLSGRFINI